MRIHTLLQVELRVFFVLLAAMLLYKLLIRQIELGGLLLRKDGSGAVSAERIQLLVATLAVSAAYWGDVVHGTGRSLPELRPEWLYVFGASSGTYTGVKAWTTLRRRALR